MKISSFKFQNLITSSNFGDDPEISWKYLSAVNCEYAIFVSLKDYHLFNKIYCISNQIIIVSLALLIQYYMEKDRYLSPLFKFFDALSISLFDNICSSPKNIYLLVCLTLLSILNWSRN